MKAQEEKSDIRMVVFNRPTQKFIPVWVTPELYDDKPVLKKYLDSIRNREPMK